jgi:hypothetical protein
MSGMTAVMYGQACETEYGDNIFDVLWVFKYAGHAV